MDFIHSVYAPSLISRVILQTTKEALDLEATVNRMCFVFHFWQSMIIFFTSTIHGANLLRPMNIIMVRSLDVACFVYSLNVYGKKIVFYPRGHAAVWWRLAWLREMSRNSFSVMRRCKGRKITSSSSFFMYKQFEKLRRMPKKRMERSIFATETCVLGATPRRTMHVYY